MAEVQGWDEKRGARKGKGWTRKEGQGRGKERGTGGQRKTWKEGQRKFRKRWTGNFQSSNEKQCKNKKDGYENYMGGGPEKYTGEIRGVGQEEDRGETKKLR